MEYRNITVVDSASNNKVTINTNATTFGELKQAVIAAGVSIEGKDWLEGITKTIPVEDNSLLPQNVQYKGQATNSLVYMLTNTGKNIKSGVLSRKECYEYIKNNDLSKDIKKQSGRNYTNLSTDSLNALIEDVVSIDSEKKVEKTSELETKYKDLLKALSPLMYFMISSIGFLEDLVKVADDIIKDTKDNFNNIPKNIKFTSKDIENMFNNK